MIYKLLIYDLLRPYNCAFSMAAKVIDFSLNCNEKKT